VGRTHSPLHLKVASIHIAQKDKWEIPNQPWEKGRQKI
jgi:hypothetical protein